MENGEGVICATTKHIAHRRVKSLREPALRERLLAEFTGTFFLVLTIGVSVTGTAMLPPVAIGLVLGVQIYTFGSVSGGFFNPAVTLAVQLCGRGKISRRDALAYAGVQIAGAVCGGVLAFAATDSTFYFDYTHSINSQWSTCFILETFFTMALCSTVLATGTSNDSPNQYFGFAIGLTVTGGAMASGGWDQGSFNPAVTLGINLANYLNGNQHDSPSAGAFLLFLFAPLLGGILAAGLFRATRGNEFEEQLGSVEASSNGVATGGASVAEP